MLFQVLLLLGQVLAQSCRSHSDCAPNICLFEQSQVGTCQTSTAVTNVTATACECSFGQVCRESECQFIVPINTTTITLMVIGVVVIIIGILLLCCWCNCCCFSDRNPSKEKRMNPKPVEPAVVIGSPPQQRPPQRPAIQEYHTEEIVEIVPIASQQPMHSIPMHSIQQPSPQMHYQQMNQSQHVIPSPHYPPSPFPNQQVTSPDYYSAQPFSPQSVSYENSPSVPFARPLEYPQQSAGPYSPQPFKNIDPQMGYYERQESPRMEPMRRNSRQTDLISRSDVARQHSVHSRPEVRMERRDSRADPRLEKLEKLSMADLNSGVERKDTRESSQIPDIGSKEVDSRIERKDTRDSSQRLGVDPRMERRDSRASSMKKYKPIMNQKVGPIVQEDPKPPKAPGFFGFWDKKGKFHQGFTDEAFRIHGGVFDDQAYFHFGVFGTVEPVFVEDHMLASFKVEEKQKKYLQVQDIRDTGDSMDVYANETYRDSLDK